MSEHDNGYKEAQRQYDNQMPPENESNTCPDCEGEGKINQSDCCGAEILGEDICADCKEHCSETICDECDGTGEIDAKSSKAEAYQEYLERKADEAREELPDIAHGGSDIDKLLNKYPEV